MPRPSAAKTRFGTTVVPCFHLDVIDIINTPVIATDTTSNSGFMNEVIPVCKRAARFEFQVAGNLIQITIQDTDISRAVDGRAILQKEDKRI